MLSDISKFERLEVPPDSHLNFVINSQDKTKNIFKNLHDEESLADMLYKKISPVGCHPGILYGQAKYTNLSLTIVHVLDQDFTLLTHHRIS